MKIQQSYTKLKIYIGNRHEIFPHDQASEPVNNLYHGQIGGFHHPTHIYLLRPPHTAMGAIPEIKYPLLTAKLAKPNAMGPNLFCY